MNQTYMLQNGFKKVQMYAERVAARYDPHSNPVCVCGGGGGEHHTPALSNVGKYADGTMKKFIMLQIYNKIAFSLYSSLLSIRYFELGKEREEREKRGIDRKCNFILDLRCYKLFHCSVGPMLLYCTTRIPNSINQ